VLFMTIPGIALFYGGLIRGKNVLSMLTQVAVTFALVCVLWIVYGYSLAFSEGNAFFGSFQWAMLKNIELKAVMGSFYQYIHVAFQASFACITVGLIVGAIAERIRFSAVLIFVGVWVTLAYLPIAHMVWAGGFLAQDGALDFAGGTVVHINAGIAGLILALIIGHSRGFMEEETKPHNLPLVMLGAALLWFGWFGFNGGSAFAADGLAGLAWINTTAAACAAMLGWLLVERVRDHRSTSLGAASGVVAGLVTITPAAGTFTPLTSLIAGLIGGILAAYGVGLKFRFRFDDSLDVVGLHLVAGLWGTIACGLFAKDIGLFTGGGSDGFKLLAVQIVIALFAALWCAVVTLIIGLALKYTMGWRIKGIHEEAGIDSALHRETAYHYENT